MKYLFFPCIIGALLSSTAGQECRAGDALTCGAPPKTEVCFIIRTYWAHGKDSGDNSLQRLLQSLQLQSDPRWEALLLVVDERPFADLQKVVSSLNDERIWIFGEWVKQGYKPEFADFAVGNYHARLYNMTDDAIRACPPTTEWVVITNGDNEYDSHFVHEIASTADDFDAVATDFYSRFQRPTAEPCRRFEEGEGFPPCKQNEMRLCHMDLGAVGWRWRRLIAEDRRFGIVDTFSNGHASDGIMASAVKEAGWKMWFLPGRCLMHHSPTPQQCAQDGMVWNDLLMTSPNSFGGSCISQGAAQDLVSSSAGTVEVVHLNVSADRGSFAFTTSHRELSCLRQANRATWKNMYTYGRLCTARMDFDSLPENLPPHAWDAWLAEDLKGRPTRGPPLPTAQ